MKSDMSEQWSVILSYFIGPVFAVISSIIGLIYRNFNMRLLKLETAIQKQEVALQKKLDKDEVADLVEYKLEPLNVYIKEIKDDIKEIKEDIKAISHGNRR